MNYYDRKGKKITPEEFFKLLPDIEYRILKQEMIGDIFISTVWLGMEHFFFQYESEEPIHIFETMLFDKSEDKKYDDIDQTYERCATEEQALIQHKEMCDIARSRINDENCK